MPSAWLNAIMIPIPKGAKCDPCVHMNYRHISLLSCISKAYSGLIIKWKIRYLKEINMNRVVSGKNRSDEEHIFSLNTMIQWIKSKTSVLATLSI